MARVCSSITVLHLYVELPVASSSNSQFATTPLRLLVSNSQGQSLVIPKGLPCPNPPYSSLQFFSFILLSFSISWFVVLMIPLLDVYKCTLQLPLIVLCFLCIYHSSPYYFRCAPLPSTAICESSSLTWSILMLLSFFLWVGGFMCPWACFLLSTFMDFNFWFWRVWLYRCQNRSQGNFPSYHYFSYYTRSPFKKEKKKPQSSLCLPLVISRSFKCFSSFQFPSTSPIFFSYCPLPSCEEFIQFWMRGLAKCYLL